MAQFSIIQYEKSFTHNNFTLETVQEMQKKNGWNEKLTGTGKGFDFFFFWRRWVLVVGIEQPASLLQPEELCFT